MEPKKKGGARAGAGKKPINPDDKKVTVPFQVKRKHVSNAKAALQPLIDMINAS
jgi:hypothetical protein